jgi:hypothetical protein
VGGIDDSVHLCIAQPAVQAIDSAEAADAYLTDRQGGVGHPACQRTGHLDVRVQPTGKGTRFRRPTQQQDSHQCLPRRIRSDE